MHFKLKIATSSSMHPQLASWSIESDPALPRAPESGTALAGPGRRMKDSKIGTMYYIFITHVIELYIK